MTGRRARLMRPREIVQTPTNQKLRGTQGFEVLWRRERIRSRQPKSLLPKTRAFTNSARASSKLANERVTPGMANESTENGVSAPKKLARTVVPALLKANGEDVKVVQELLRHASSKITLDTYTQAVTPAKRRAHSKVVRMILPWRKGRLALVSRA